MPNYTLPNGDVRHVEEPVTGLDLVGAIGPGLAKATLAMDVDGHLCDIRQTLKHDCHVRFVTRKDPQALELIRHDAAHVMAQAVQNLFPGTQVTIGPAIKDGFYYDFCREQPFSSEDFLAIEKEMHRIVKLAEPFEREVWPRQQAIDFFEKHGEKFKAELIRSFPEDEEVSIYRQGEWLDLCRGPHMRTTADVGDAFKLMKVAGAYWRGDHRNPMLTRIYGTAWRDKKELRTYLHQLEEAAKRDHRRIGKEMDLFHFQEEALGQVFWHPKGWNLFSTIQNYMRRAQYRYDYEEVNTPELVDRRLWEESGHWDKYRQNMFITRVDDEEKTLALKPMNCPCHVQIFSHDIRSYRQLPIRMAEFGSCHRYEPSGSLHGLMRVRGFVQDDAHIFCTEDQIASETAIFVKMLYEVYHDLGFDSVHVRFADRPPQRAGDDAIWDKAENALKKACKQSEITYELNKGDGAFYGPKLEFVLRDAIGREWQCGTLQVDFVLPQRLNVSYIGEDSAKHRPVMLHRAILGSFERFIGILIEQYAGKFPLWMAPVQVVVASIVDDAAPYAQDVARGLRNKNVRVQTDLRSDKISAKIREHSLQHVPIIMIVGRNEMQNETVTMRRLGVKEQKEMKWVDAIDMISLESMPPDIKDGRAGQMLI